MPFNVNNTRILQKRSYLTGATPTLRTGSTDFQATYNEWTPNDIITGELYLNVSDNKAWFGDSTGVTQFITDKNISSYTTGGTSTSPGGVNTNVQFNNGGTFGGDSGFIYEPGQQSVQIGGNVFGTGSNFSFETGENNTMQTATRSAIIGGNNNSITNLDGVVILGGTGITATQSNTVYAHNLSSTTIQTDYTDFNINISAPTHLEGRLYYNNQEKALTYQTDVTGTSIQIGQESVVRVVNKTGVQINNGQVVYIEGAQGNRPKVVLASNTGETTSSETIGVATNDISHNAVGYITVFGIVRDLNTNSYTEGDILYLGSTPGTFTNIKPNAPFHAVKIGYVTYSHLNQGEILVNIDNGYELDELHNVSKSITGATNYDLLQYSASSQTWVASKDLSANTISANTITTQQLDNNEVVYYYNGLTGSTKMTYDGSELTVYSPGPTQRLALQSSGLWVYGSTTGTTQIRAICGTLTDGGSGRLNLYTAGNSQTIALNSNGIATFANSGGVTISAGALNQCLTLGGTINRIIAVDRNTIAGGSLGRNLTINAGAALAASSNQLGGDLILSTGIATGSGSSKMSFYTTTAGTAGSGDTTPTEKMTILGDGNVGIGKTPSVPLDVNGNIRLYDSLIFGTTTLGTKIQVAGSTYDFLGGFNRYAYLGNYHLSLFGSVATTRGIHMYGDSDATIDIERISTTGVTGKDLILKAGGAATGDLNRAGGGIKLYAGKNTGTAYNSNFTFYGSRYTTSAGTHDNTQVELAKIYSSTNGTYLGLNGYIAMTMYNNGSALILGNGNYQQQLDSGAFYMNINLATPTLRVGSGYSSGAGTGYDFGWSSNGTGIQRTWGLMRNLTAGQSGGTLILKAGAPSGSTTNLNGGELRLSSGISTGSGSSYVSIYTATAGSSGTTDVTPTEKMRIDGDGSLYTYSGGTLIKGFTGTGTYTNFTIVNGLIISAS